VADAFDVPRTNSTITQTLEVGYKGIIGRNYVVAVDAYRSDVEDFVGPLRVETPNVFLDPTVLGAQLGQAFGAALADPANAQVAAVLGALDQMSIPGLYGDLRLNLYIDSRIAFYAGAGVYTGSR